MQDIDPDHKPDSRNWPLHLKHVGAVDLDAVSTLPTGNLKVDHWWNDMRSWLDDDTRYRDVPVRGSDLPITRFTTTQIEAMIEFNKCRRITRDQARGPVCMWPKAEPCSTTHADRNRIIGDTTLMNEFIPTNSCTKVHQTQRGELHAAYATYKYAAHFDFSAWFDQLKYSEEVGQRASFLDCHGNCYCLTAASMGSRPIPQTAGAATWKIASIPLVDTTHHHFTGVIIDNTIFMSNDLAHLKSLVTQFFARCTTAKAKLNDVTTLEEALARIVENFEFCGEKVNLGNGTVQCLMKTLNKVRRGWALKETWSYRQLAAFYGILFYANSTLRIPMADFYEAIKYHRDMSTTLEAIPELWNAPAPPTPPMVLSQLERWTLLVLENTPRPCGTEVECIGHLMVDASDWGYAGTFVDRNGAVNTIQKAWEPTFCWRGNSAVAEPIAAIRCAVAVTRPDVMGYINVVTDHLSALPQFIHEYSRNYIVNGGFQWINNLRPHLVLRGTHIEGTANLCDARSRGKMKSAQELAQEINSFKDYLHARVNDGNEST
jgi:hypothetical protein